MANLPSRCEKARDRRLWCAMARRCIGVTCARLTIYDYRVRRGAGAATIDRSISRPRWSAEDGRLKGRIRRTATKDDQRQLDGIREFYRSEQKVWDRAGRRSRSARSGLRTIPMAFYAKGCTCLLSRSREEDISDLGPEIE